MTVSTRETAKNLWRILFDLQGSIWTAVLPYCLLNCTLMIIVEVLAVYEVKIAFSPSGHGLMTLIISYLVISKVNLAYARYMDARHAIGHALSSLRELNQTALLYTERMPPSDKLASQWRQQNAKRIIDLIDCTIRVLKNPNQANYLARGVGDDWKTNDDPMLHSRGLKSQVYTVNQQIFGSNTTESHKNLELFERTKMIDLVHEFEVNYRNLLICASTPVPFPLVQMARTFLFIWTFTIPLVLRGVVSEFYSALAFVFFLTYGFVGLEVCSIKLMSPFGESKNDLNITGMRHATIIGIERDLQIFGEQAKLRDPRVEFSRQKPQPPMKTVYDNADVYTSESIETPYHNGTYMHSSHDDLYHPPGC